jgi:hypothetical protein
VNELRSRSLVVKEPTVAQMTELCALIYQNRLQHAVDTRIRLIESMQTILDFLTTNGIVAAGTSQAIILQDVWNYFPRVSRRFGFQVRAGLGFEYDYGRNHSSERSRLVDLLTRYPEANPGDLDTTAFTDTVSVTDYAQARESTLPYLLMRFEYARPLNLKWQFDADVTAKYFVNARLSSKYGGDYGKDYQSYQTLKASGMFQFIVNSRTMATFSSSVSYSHYNVKLRSYADAIPVSSPERIQHSLDYTELLTLEYRISIPTTLTATCSYNHIHYPYAGIQNTSTDDISAFRASISLSHYLF